MKRLLFAVTCLMASHIYFGQANISVIAPPPTFSVQNLAPNGSSGFAYMRGCFLITQNELSALTSSMISVFGFSLGAGANISVSGNMTVYMQNTGDLSYSKGNNYTNAINGMTNVYAGPMTIPAGTTNTATILMNLSSPFNYTGGAIYVAFNWIGNSPYAATAATYAGNSSQVGGAFRNLASNNTTALNSLVTSSSRPVCIFQGANSATNEAGVIGITAPGKVPEAQHSPQIIMANIKNLSNAPLNNLPVILQVRGDNVFTATQTINSIAAGAVQTVTFSNFNPVYLGSDTIQVRLNPDQNTKNNSLTWIQEVVCDKASNSPAHIPPFPYTSGYPQGGISTSRFNFPVTTTLYAVDVGIANDFASDQKKVYGVLMDGLTGGLIATTNTITINTSMFNTVQTLTFSPPEVLNALSDYHVGMAQPQGGHFPYMLVPADSSFVPGSFFDSPLSGGSFSIDPTGYSFYDLHLSGIDVSITQPATVMCYGATMELIANGASTYTWASSIFSPIDFPNHNDIFVKPTGNEIYTVTATDDAGCEGNATAPIMVVPCLDTKDQAANTDQLNLFPNPTANGMALLTGLRQQAELRIYNLLGELVFFKTIKTDDAVEIDISAQPAGTYLVTIAGGNTAPRTLKLFKP